MPPNWGLKSSRETVAVTVDGISQVMRNRLRIKGRPFNGRFRSKARPKPMRNEIPVEMKTYLNVSSSDSSTAGSLMTLM